jgi:type III secretory pathway component EscR
MIKAAWILFSVGALVGCFFPPFIGLLVATLALGIVAICQKQRRHGIALVIGSVIMMPVCAAVFAMLALGAVGTAVKNAHPLSSPKTLRLR